MKIFILIFSIFFLLSCNSNDNKESKNIFYFDFITEDDSLNSFLIQKTYSKVIYMDNEAKVFRVVPSSYATNKNEKEMRIFHISEAPKDLKNKMNKLEIKINNNMNIDSVSYSVRKFIFLNDKWNFKSDLGTINIPFTGYRFSTNNRFRNDIATKLVSSMFNDIYFSY